MSRRNKFLLFFKSQYASKTYKKTLFSKLAEFEIKFYNELESNDSVKNSFEHILSDFIGSKCRNLSAMKRSSMSALQSVIPIND